MMIRQMTIPPAEILPAAATLPAAEILPEEEILPAAVILPVAAILPEAVTIPREETAVRVTEKISDGPMIICRTIFLCIYPNGYPELFDKAFSAAA